jgi:hypothetical protein
LAADALISQFENLLTVSGIQVPPDLRRQVEARNLMASARVEADGAGGQRLQVQLPPDTAYSSSSPAATLSGQTTDAPQSTVSNTSFTGWPLDREPYQLATLGHSGQVSSPATDQIGVDFVLSLEQICLYHHLDWDSPELNQLGQSGATGHAAMLQNPILRRAPPLVLDAQTFGRPSSSTWSVPAAELERLLALSPQLDFTNEITPVQAWRQIQNHPEYGRLLPVNVEGLCQDLLPSVRCYGFGAAIDHTIFQHLFESMWETVD